jgi:hypothetical protein
MNCDKHQHAFVNVCTFCVKEKIEAERVMVPDKPKSSDVYCPECKQPVAVLGALHLQPCSHEVARELAAAHAEIERLKATLGVARETQEVIAVERDEARAKLISETETAIRYSQEAANLRADLAQRDRRIEELTVHSACHCSGHMYWRDEAARLTSILNMRDRRIAELVEALTSARNALKYDAPRGLPAHVFAAVVKKADAALSAPAQPATATKGQWDADTCGRLCEFECGGVCDMTPGHEGKHHCGTRYAPPSPAPTVDICQDCKGTFPVSCMHYFAAARILCDACYAIDQRDAAPPSPAAPGTDAYGPRCSWKDALGDRCRFLSGHRGACEINITEPTSRDNSSSREERLGTALRATVDALDSDYVSRAFAIATAHGYTMSTKECERVAAVWRAVKEAVLIQSADHRLVLALVRRRRPRRHRGCHRLRVQGRTQEWGGD